MATEMGLRPAAKELNPENREAASASGAAIAAAAAASASAGRSLGFIRLYLRTRSDECRLARRLYAIHERLETATVSPYPRLAHGALAPWRPGRMDPLFDMSGLHRCRTFT